MTTFDPKRLEAASMGDRGFAAELTRLFIDDVGEQLSALSAAIEARDAERIAGVAHRVKGSSGNVGAERLSALCASLEADGRAGVVDDMAERRSAIEEEFSRVRQSLVAFADAGG